MGDNEIDCRPCPFGKPSAGPIARCVSSVAIPHFMKRSENSSEAIISPPSSSKIALSGNFERYSSFDNLTLCISILTFDFNR